jgi:hypothetical protein
MQVNVLADPSVGGSYGVPEESLLEEQDATQGGGAYIVRLAAGNPDVYLRKELLWPFIREFADRATEYACKKQAELEHVHGQACRACPRYGFLINALVRLRMRHPFSFRRCGLHPWPLRRCCGGAPVGGCVAASP